MYKQTEVKFIGFKAKNYKTVEAVEFTYDVLQNKIIRIIGEIGSSKTSILECIEIALTGVKGIGKKDTIRSGFLSEIQLTDGDVKLWLGVKAREKSRGKDAGETVIETFIYTKKEDGSVDNKPIVNGKLMTAKDYIKILNSDLSFNLKDLFSKNAVIHRNFLEKTYSSELKGLGVDEVVDRIKKAKDKQDGARSLCDAVGAFMGTFKEEGYDENSLADLVHIDIEKIRDEITTKKIEKDRLLNDSETAKELARMNAQKVKDDAIGAIKTKAARVVEDIREINDRKMKEFSGLDEKFKKFTINCKEIQDNTDRFSAAIFNEDWIDIKTRALMENMVHKEGAALINKLGKTPIKPIEPKIIPIVSGRIEMPDEYDKEYESLVSLRNKYLSDYAKIKAKDLEIKPLEPVNTKLIDIEIDKLNTKLIGAENNNDVHDRYIKWLDWIEAKGIYQKEIDTLRKIYAKVDTGVDGLKIIPKQEKGRTEIWLQYDGQYDPEFFDASQGMRYITDFSESQRGIIGVLLQAARLNKKHKALRLALIDSTPFHTKVGMSILSKVQNDMNIQLITTHTSDMYDKEDLSDGVVVMEGGEAFFKTNK